MTQKTREYLNTLALPSGDAFDLPTSPKRFPDGAQYRVEIPSVEGPRALAAVLEEAERQSVLIHRVSQGSGIMLLTDEEIREMAQLGHAAGIEVSLFVGPRVTWDTGAQVTASAGKNLGARMRGMDQIVLAAEDIRRACALGMRSVLVAGLLLIIFGFEVLGSPLVVIVAAITPLGLSLGLVMQYLPTLTMLYTASAFVGLTAFAVTRIAAPSRVGTIVLGVVHGLAGLIIFGLPILFSLQGRTPIGFALVGVGGALIGLGGLLLAFLKAGRPILSQNIILAELPGLLLLTTAAFVAGFAAASLR